MSDFDAFRESQLLAITRGQSGWVGESRQLSAADHDEILDLLSRRMTENDLERFRVFLPKVFADTLEMEIARKRIRETLDTLEREVGTRSKTAKRLGPRLRARLEGYRTEIAEHGDAWTDEERREFCDRLARDAEIAALATPLLEERIRPLATEPLTSAPTKAIEELSTVLDLIASATSAGVKSGVTDAAFEQMALTLARLFTDVTGRPPTRIFDPYAEPASGAEGARAETGPFVEVCRVMARAVNNALPPEYQRPQPPDMAKACRRAATMVREEAC